MIGWIKRRIEGIKEHRKKKAEERLSRLKWRYNIFRSLLYKNTRAVDIITELDLKLRQRGELWPGIYSEVNELIETTHDMVDMLNQIDGGRHKLLFDKHHHIKTGIDQLLKDVVDREDAPFCVKLEDVFPHYYTLAGKKALNLSLLKRSGDLNVPDGFVVLVNGCRFFLEESGLKTKIIKELQPVISNDKEITEDIEIKIREEILNTPIPKRLEDELRSASSMMFESGKTLAVRSSGLGEDSKHKSFAGQFSSFLNVATFDSLKDAFKKVMASNFSARSIAYRISSNMNPVDFDMAVLCVEMIDAEKSGVMFTLDPNSPDERNMLITAIWGMGELLVSGEIMADVYRIKRNITNSNGYNESSVEKVVVTKTRQLKPAKGGSLVEVEVPEELRNVSVLSDEEIDKLVLVGKKIERLYEGEPQDIEWVIDHHKKVWVVQTRPLVLGTKKGCINIDGLNQKPILEKGISTSRGRVGGIVKKIHSKHDLDSLDDKPYILVMRRSFVDAARVMGKIQGLVVGYGNPGDHLSCVARELGKPMIVGVGDSIEKLKDGDWVVVDGDRARVYLSEKDEVEKILKDKDKCDSALIQDSTKIKGEKNRLLNGTYASFNDHIISRFREYTVKLNLTDAYGPSFSIVECKSLHDIVRYVHEKAVLAMFDASDEVLEGTSSVVYKIDTDLPLFFHLIDIGGGIAANLALDKNSIPVDIVESRPFRALWKGISTPGLRWSGPPPVVGGVSSVVGRWLSDSRSGRELGMPNYVIVARDYLNLNARMDFHFAMIDTVCGREERLNYIRFRFKGGGTNMVQRHRRAIAIGEILERVDFYTDVRGDLVNAVFQSAPLFDVEERLCVLGKLLGFTRLIDAAMVDEDSPHIVADSFFEGDYSLSRLLPS